MNRKYNGCKVNGCKNKHKGHEYCVNHLRKWKLGTLDIGPHSKLCSHDNCFKKHYCKGYCITHYSRMKKNLPMNMPKLSKNSFYSNLNFEHKFTSSWSISVRQYYGKKCMNCNWEKTSCDVHHILPKKKGGKNTLQNAVVLCPNCHRLAHENKLTIQDLIKIKNKLPLVVSMGNNQ